MNSIPLHIHIMLCIQVQPSCICNPSHSLSCICMKLALSRVLMPYPVWFLCTILVFLHISNWLAKAMRQLIAITGPACDLLGKSLSSHAVPELPWQVGSALHLASSKAFSQGLVNVCACACASPVIEQDDCQLYTSNLDVYHLVHMTILAQHQ